MMRPLLRRDIPAAVSAMDDPWARAHLSVTQSTAELSNRLSRSLDAVGDDPHRSEHAIVWHGKVVGVRSLSELEPGVLLTGSWLHASVRGQGLGSRSLAAIRSLAHHHLGFPQLLSATQPHNLPAVSMLRRSGMTLLTESWPHISDDGTFVDCVWFLSHTSARRC